MLNKLEFYRDCGVAAAKAMNQKDMARYDFVKRHLRQCVACESPKDRQLAMQEYETGYRTVRALPPTENFR